jgi:hypothetical protein
MKHAPHADAQALEALLARLYTDDALCNAFLAAPEAVARQAGLAEASVQGLLAIDRDGLRLTAASLAARRVADRGARP